MHNNSFLNKALAVTLAATMTMGCALPVCAAEAKAGISKEETVYVVLNEDGSIKSQTVSDHLHSDSGLSGVADESRLQNITNTQGDATFTQDGNTLHWDTEDTDVYYKGETTDTPPVSVSISYQINGNHVSPEDLIGQSGHLTINVALSNNTMETVTVGTEETAKTRTVCTPFAAVVGTMLSEDTFKNVTAEHGMVQSDGGSSIVGFVALPGVKACVNDLLPSQVDSLTDYLVDSVTIEADVTDCTMPSIMVACAADASLLSGGDDDLMDKLDEIDDLQSDLDKLTDAMDQLTDGATKLNNGVGDLRNGAKELSTGTGTLLNSSATLKDGVNTLNDGASQLYDGASQLKDGTGKLRSGSVSLQENLGTLSGGLNTLAAQNGTLNSSAQQLADGVLSLVNTALKTSGVITEDMTWATYADVLAAALGVNDEMRAQARAQIAQQVKEKTGNDLTEEQLNCLIYMTAVAMGTNSGNDLNATVSAQGDKMNKAATDAAGSIKAAQDALAGASNNPLAVDEVNAAMENAALQTIYSQINQGDNNALLLTMAADAITVGTQTDLTAAVTAAGASATAVLTAKGALAAANNDRTAIAAVESLLTAVKDAYSLDDTTAAYNTLAGQINADNETKALIITMAAQSMAATASTNVNAAIAAAIAAASAAAQAVQTAKATLTAAGGNVMAGNVKTLIDTNYVPTAYSTVAGQVNAGSDEINALVITMAALSLASGSQTDLSAALTSCGATLTNANEVQNAMTVANNGDVDAQNLIKSFLTGLVSTASSDSIKQISDLNTLLSGEQALLAGLKAYTGGVATAADGAGKICAAVPALVDGAKQVDDGAGTLKEKLGELHTGTQTLASGVATLGIGAAKLNDGAKTLYNGTGDLKKGTGDLVDGVNKLNDEGISKLTDGLDVDQLSTLKDIATEMKNRQEDYTSYSGAPEGISASVKFVMKTAENTEKTTATTPAADDAAATEAKPSLWKRFLALFGIGKN